MQNGDNVNKHKTADKLTNSPSTSSHSTAPPSTSSHSTPLPSTGGIRSRVPGILGIVARRLSRQLFRELNGEQLNIKIGNSTISASIGESGVNFGHATTTEDGKTTVGTGALALKGSKVGLLYESTDERGTASKSCVLKDCSDGISVELASGTESLDERSNKPCQSKTLEQSAVSEQFTVGNKNIKVTKTKAEYDNRKLHTLQYNITNSTTSRNTGSAGNTTPEETNDTNSTTSRSTGSAGNVIPEETNDTNTDQNITSPSSAMEASSATCAQSNTTESQLA